jgi:glycosyltransferase involved in cell wall biosynthesis
LEPLLNRYIAEYGKPDVVHAHNLMSGGLIARRIWMETGIPYVVTEHSSSFLSASGIAERDIATLRLAASGAKAVVAVGSQLASSLVEVLGGNTSAPIKVIPNVVDQRLLDLAVRGDHPVYTVVGLGNLIPRKNFSLLIRAFAQADLPADARLVIGGEGSEGRRLKALAKSLLVGDRVEFTGSLDRQRVGQILQDADLFAHSADIETFGVVLIEALAVGLPVLATDSFGPRDIVTPDTGTLTPVADLQAFTEGLSMMYTRRGEFEAARLRRNCHERFSSEVFASRMLWIYQEATS